MSYKKYLLVVDEDVVGSLTIPCVEKFKLIQEAIVSGITIMEVPVDTEVAIGWQYDGTTFYSKEDK